MGKFAWFSTIPHHHHTIEVFVSGNTEVESKTADDETRALGLCGSVKVFTKNLSDGEDQYCTVNTYVELRDLLKSSYKYLEYLKCAISSYRAVTEGIVLLRNAHEKIYNDVCPMACALYCIQEGISEKGWAVWLNGARDESDESGDSNEGGYSVVTTPSPEHVEPPKPKSPLPDPIPIQNQAQPTASRIPPTPAPRKKLPMPPIPPNVSDMEEYYGKKWPDPAPKTIAPVVPTPKTAPVNRETAPPRAYDDLMKPPQESGMEDYYGRGARAAIPKAPTVEIIPSIRDLHLPVSAQPVVFRTHTAHPIPSVLDRIGTMTLDAASRIAEANSNLAAAATRKLKTLKLTKNHGFQGV